MLLIICGSIAIVFKVLTRPQSSQGIDILTQHGRPNSHLSSLHEAWLLLEVVEQYPTWPNTQAFLQMIREEVTPETVNFSLPGTTRFSGGTEYANFDRFSWHVVLKRAVYVRGCFCLFYCSRLNHKCVQFACSCLVGLCKCMQVYHVIIHIWGVRSIDVLMVLYGVIPSFVISSLINFCLYYFVH